jgi:hypothetical protein
MIFDKELHITSINNFFKTKYFLLLIIEIFYFVMSSGFSKIYWDTSYAKF